MALFATSCLDRIRQQVSIVDVVSPYVQLKSSGHYLKGLSPFSNEKTPSFFVDPQKNIFKCFSTGYAGDAFRFIELKEQLTFPEAVEWLCDKFHIPIEYSDGQAVEKMQTSFKKDLFGIYGFSAQFFKDYFWSDEALAQKARRYWTQERHFSLETAKTFDIGLAPLTLDALYQFLFRKGYSRENLEQSGLFYRSKAPHSGLISRFQGRLMFPISDIQGRTIAFSGRHLPWVNLPNDPTRESKYVNSPETPIFVKGNELFNIARARQALTDHNIPIYLVEGPLDVIRCWECGLQTVVAPQGTGLTEAQLKLLKRYDTPLVGMFDGDTAGLKAGVRFMTLGIPLELTLRYYLLEPEEDPDTAFFKNPQRCAELSSQCLSPIDFFIAVLKRHNEDPERIPQKILQQVFPILLQCQSSVLRFDLLQKLSKSLQIPYAILEEDLNRLSTKKPVEKAFYSKEGCHTNVAAVETLEGQVLLFLFHAPKWIPQLLSNLSLDWIDTSHTVGKLLLKILNEFQGNGIEPLNDRSQWHLSEEETNLWGIFLAGSVPQENQREALNLILQQMNRKFLKKMIFTIDKDLIKDSNMNPRILKQLQMDRFLYKKALADLSSTVYFKK